MSPPPKGKDIGAMSARMGSTQQRAPVPLPGPPPPPEGSAVVPPAPPGGGGMPKGKDLARMAMAAPAPPVPPPGPPPTGAPVGIPIPVSHPAAMRASFSGPPGAAPPVQVPAPNNMTLEQRQEIARRKAYGMNAPMPYQSFSQSAHPLSQHRPLVPNASQPPQPVDIKVAKAKKPTKRPSHAESRLSKAATRARAPTAKSDDTYGNASLPPAIGEKLQKLCHSIDPSYTLDSEVQERLVEMADSFVDKVTKDAVRLARHRGSGSLDVVDVALALKKGYNISVPGLGPPSVARGKGQSVVALSGVGSTAVVGGQYGQYAGGGMKGGWLFADKVNPPAGRKSKKRREVSSSNAAAVSC